GQHRAKLTAGQVERPSPRVAPGPWKRIGREARIVFAGVLKADVDAQLELKLAFEVGISFTANYAVADALNGHGLWKRPAAFQKHFAGDKYGLDDGVGRGIGTRSRSRGPGICICISSGGALRHGCQGQYSKTDPKPGPEARGAENH